MNSCICVFIMQIEWYVIILNDFSSDFFSHPISPFGIGWHCSFKFLCTPINLKQLLVLKSQSSDFGRHYVISVFEIRESFSHSTHWNKEEKEGYWNTSLGKKTPYNFCVIITKSIKSACERPGWNDGFQMEYFMSSNYLTFRGRC